MNAVELAVEKVKALSEEEARTLLGWLPSLKSACVPAKTPSGALAALGYARKYRRPPRSTAEWIKELREGED